MWNGYQGRVSSYRAQASLLGERASTLAWLCMTEPAGLDWIGPKEAAAVLGVVPNTVSRWCREGKIPFVFTPGGRRRFVRSDIEELAATVRPDEFGV